MTVHYGTASMFKWSKDVLVEVKVDEQDTSRGLEKGLLLRVPEHPLPANSAAAGDLRLMGIEAGAHRKKAYWRAYSHT